MTDDEMIAMLKSPDADDDPDTLRTEFIAHVGDAGFDARVRDEVFRYVRTLGVLVKMSEGHTAFYDKLVAVAVP